MAVLLNFVVLATQVWAGEAASERRATGPVPSLAEDNRRDRLGDGANDKDDAHGAQVPAIAFQRDTAHRPLLRNKVPKRAATGPGNGATLPLRMRRAIELRRQAVFSSDRGS